ncbi:MAG: hypothetical protein SR1Q5_00735 [Quinella sp. 1Q5]|nr:hypothetical protein [Quinella sp. 1Q5]
MTYRDNEVVDYCAGKGLLFAVPVMHGGNVQAVIYRLYSEKLLTDLFGLAEYNSDAKLLIQERNGQILANMSHEIRTPLNAIVGMNEMILRESQSPDIINYAQNASAASETLLSLINDILDFSKIESGKLALVEDNYNLRDIIKSLVTMMKPRAEKKIYRSM